MLLLALRFITPAPVAAATGAALGRISPAAGPAGGFAPGSVAVRTGMPAAVPEGAALCGATRGAVMRAPGAVAGAGGARAAVGADTAAPMCWQGSCGICMCGCSCCAAEASKDAAAAMALVAGILSRSGSPGCDAAADEVWPSTMEPLRATLVLGGTIKLSSSWYCNAGGKLRTSEAKTPVSCSAAGAGAAVAAASCACSAPGSVVCALWVDRCAVLGGMRVSCSCCWLVCALLVQSVASMLLWPVLMRCLSPGWEPAPNSALPAACAGRAAQLACPAPCSPLLTPSVLTPSKLSAPSTDNNPTERLCCCWCFSTGAATACAGASAASLYPAGSVGASTNDFGCKDEKGCNASSGACADELPAAAAACRSPVYVAERNAGAGLPLCCAGHSCCPCQCWSEPVASIAVVAGGLSQVAVCSWLLGPDAAVPCCAAANSMGAESMPRCWRKHQLHWKLCFNGFAADLCTKVRTSVFGHEGVGRLSSLQSASSCGCSK